MLMIAARPAKKNRQPAGAAPKGSAQAAATVSKRTKCGNGFMADVGVKTVSLPQNPLERYGPDGMGQMATRQPGARESCRDNARLTGDDGTCYLGGGKTAGLLSLVTFIRLLLLPASPPPPHPVKRILVIDDDVRLRQQCVELLRLDGYDVLEAGNGREGVELARQKLPDLVLCDVTMPEMNGHRVLETLRAETRTAHLPFVFLTGWSEREDVRTGMNLGADDYLVKPVVPDELSAAVRARLARAEKGPPRRPTAEPMPSMLETLGLTPREAEVLFWVARGKTNDEIAIVLGVGRTTVKKHLESTFVKLSVENRTAAAATALERMAAG